MKAKKNVFRNGIPIAFTAMSMTTLLGIGARVYETRAAEETITADSVTFETEKGASVRISDAEDGNGLRYGIRMPAEDYTDLRAAYDEVSFGILIAPADYVEEYGELNAQTVFGVGGEQVYDWAVKDENGDWQYDGDKIRIVNFETAELFVSEGDENLMVYYGSLVDLLENNIAREFVGTGYIKYMDAGSTSYRFTAGNDNVRSMAYVAQMAIADDSGSVTAEQKQKLQALYIDKVADMPVNYKVEHYLETKADEYTLADTETLSALLDADVSAAVKTYANFELNEEKSEADGKALANDKLVLKLYYDYAPDYSDLEFSDEYSLQLVQSGVEPQIVDDADAVDGKALQITFKYDDFAPSGRVDATIDLGGLWKVSEIGQIVIRYKIISGNSGTYWRLYPNDITDDSRRFYGNGMTYSSSTTSQGTPTAGYETVTIPQSALKMNGGNNAILTDDDYLSSISFAEVSWRSDTGWRMIIQIDSVEIQPVVGFEEDFLQFAEDNALAAVLSGVNPQIIDDPDASDGKALRAAFRSPDLDWNGKRDLKIDLGGLYKVSEIESVVIRYKIPEGYNFANYWWRIFLNDLTEDDDLRVYKQGAIIYSAATTSQGISTDGYQTITIMQEALKGNDLTPAGGTAHDLLSDDDYLTAITFAGVSARNEGERDIEFVIDSITINLK